MGYKKFTVITIACNEEKKIAETMQSVLSQDYKDLEYLVIDGASSDHTVEIAEKLADESGRDVKIYSEPDFGIYNAMNRGIARASGDYAIFMNAGDSFFGDTVLSNIEKRIRQHGRAIYYGKACLTRYGRIKKIHDFAEKGYSVYDAMMKSHMPMHQSIVAPTDALRKYYFCEEYKIRADYDWLFKCYRERIRFINLDFVVCRYDYSGVSTKAMRDNSLQAETVIIRNKYYPVMGRVYQWADRFRMLF